MTSCVIQCLFYVQHPIWCHENIGWIMARITNVIRIVVAVPESACKEVW